MADEQVFRFVIDEETTATAGGGGVAGGGAGVPAPTQPASQATRRRDDTNAAAGGAGQRTQDKQNKVEGDRKAAGPIKDFATQAAAAKLGKFQAPARALAAEAFGGVAAAAGPLAVAGAVVGVAAAGVAAGVALSRAQAATADRLAALSPDIAVARARVDVARTRQNLALARRIGPEIARAEEASGALTLASQRLRSEIAASVFGEEVTAVKSTLAEATNAIAVAVAAANTVLPSGPVTAARAALGFDDPLGVGQAKSIFDPEGFRHLEPENLPSSVDQNIFGRAKPFRTDIPFTTGLPQ